MYRSYYKYFLREHVSFYYSCHFIRGCSIEVHCSHSKICESIPCMHWVACVLWVGAGDLDSHLWMQLIVITDERLYEQRIGSASTRAFMSLCWHLTFAEHYRRCHLFILVEFLGRKWKATVKHNVHNGPQRLDFVQHESGWNRSSGEVGHSVGCAAGISLIHHRDAVTWGYFLSSFAFTGSTAHFYSSLCFYGSSVQNVACT